MLLLYLSFLTITEKANACCSRTSASLHCADQECVRDRIHTGILRYLSGLEMVKIDIHPNPDMTRNARNGPQEKRSTPYSYTNQPMLI